MLALSNIELDLTTHTPLTDNVSVRNQKAKSKHVKMYNA